MEEVYLINTRMTVDEARVCINIIRSCYRQARVMLLDLHERRGREVLGYKNWRECVVGEFGQSEAYLYNQLQAAKIERNISSIEEIGVIPEWQLRPLQELEIDQQREAWTKAVETAPNGKITGAHVQDVVDEILQKPHVTFNSGNNEWYTPAEYIEAARRVMDGIDLDPASSDIANRTIGAAVYFTAEDDGLRYAWDGRIWMNPPYAGELIGKFTDKLSHHFLSGEITEAIVLVNNATETVWFQSLLVLASAVCFLKGRVKFIDMNGFPSGAPLQGQAILYLGNNPAAFNKEFLEFGVILYAR